MYGSITLHIYIGMILSYYQVHYYTCIKRENPILSKKNYVFKSYTYLNKIHIFSKPRNMLFNAPHCNTRNTALIPTKVHYEYSRIIKCVLNND